MESYIKQGDCLELLQEIPKQSINCIICDPPYNIGYDNWDNNFDTSKLLELLYHVLSDNGNLIIFQGWSNVSNTISLALQQGFILQDWIIYDRIKGRGAKRHLVSTREDILWLTKSDEYIFNKIPSNILKKTGGMGKKNGCEYRALSNVWTDIPPIVPWSKEKVAHPTQKPVKLIERCINIWSNIGYVILDPCMGSGTTCVAAINTNRKYIGFELNQNYYDISKKRIKEANHG